MLLMKLFQTFYFVVLCLGTAHQIAGSEALTSGTLDANEGLGEWSGLIASSLPGITWWAHNDGGNPAEVVGLDENLQVVKRFPIAATNTDWEDIAAHNGLLFIADTGDNQMRRESVTILAFPEPSLDSASPLTVTQRWTLQFPDAAHDVEALVMTADHGWLIDKRPAGCHIWHFDRQGPAEQTLVDDGAFALPSPVLAADISHDGNTLVLAHPLGVSRIPMTAGDLRTVQLNQATTTMLGLALQRESVAFSADGLHIVTGCEDGRWWRVSP